MTRDAQGRFVKEPTRTMKMVRQQTMIVTLSLLGLAVMVLEMYVL